MDRPWKLDALLRLLMLGCLGIGVSSLALLALQRSMEQRLTPDNLEFYRQAAGFLSLQGLGLVWLYLFVREHDVNAAAAFGFRNAPARSVGRALLTMVIVFPLIIVVMNLMAVLMQKFFGFVPPEQQTVGFLKNHPPLWQTALLGFVAVVLAPVAEEMLFRGVLYTFLKQRGFPRLALWGTATLFGFIHFNLGAFIPLICLALVWTWLYERTRNLLAPITAHVLFNAVNFIALTANLPDWLEKLIEMNEIELISRLLPTLTRNESVVVAAGDDCAVLDLGAPEHLLFKTDAIVEGIHFTHETPPDKIGRKALARCLSDIAAMGGKPNSAVVTLALPKDFEVARIEKIYEGLNRLAAMHKVAIVGGETTTNPDRVLISIALLGTVEKGRALLRSGAKAGDALFVTGTLGGSLHGRHLDFEPRLKEARWLAKNFDVHSMIDLSDGLASDLRHVLQASQVGADLLARSLPISREAKLSARAESSAKPPLLAALTDGEDFELLFTVKSKDAVRLMDAWKAQFPEVPLTCIGRITAQPGLRLRDKDGVRTLNVHGYTHFEKP